MKTTTIPNDTLFVLFGAEGDLSWRLVIPALFNLFLDGHLPQRFHLIAVDRADTDAAALAAHYLKGVTENSRKGAPQPEEWKGFAGSIRYIKADATKLEGFKILADTLDAQEAEWASKAERVFYLATPPSLFELIAIGLGAAGLAQDRERVRLVVEKPLGSDLESFREINTALCRIFEERQLFRIDHFLGKETVQNILAMRFANPIFEPIWNRRYVDHVTITAAETLGVEKRGGYYEHAGALRDMVQNHLIQLLCLVAMEPPVSYDADDIRNRKVDVLHALRQIAPDDVDRVASRGQYAEGWIHGDKLPPYRAEPGVDPHSNIETYAALKLYVDNWRWQDVPFYLRTGKRMASDVSEISIRFRDVPHHAFPASVGLNTQPVRLVIQLNPEQGIVLKFMAKEPGSPLRLRPVDMRFSYKEAFQVDSPAAYETLLWDVMLGDATLFMRADQVEAAWKLLMPILRVWAENPASDFPNYAAGSWGPESSDLLVACDGNSWLAPTLTKP
ncbi:glucose-6-phosphate dehydrogenase [Sideroxydans lithotrophicus]|uniref:Glucose-6-phosphate 1-dehydrogenase n=1 Tax=Sideroxydans lithotrophicus (strain ES-1) TaxID=580332 RepID=D5CM22_SIDLE|nr:glucose-6-phosphate dehydrogenase [Sideroxydans lithotrophicus]ADE10636.1 glucose-6-phosphate 1-dehydrogenase [Sideroxydans lithotrophicus ES-1]